MGSISHPSGLNQYGNLLSHSLRIDEAIEEIQMVTQSDGVVWIGPPVDGESIRSPVAHASAVDDMKAALKVFATALTTATTFTQIQTAATALSTALNLIPPSGTNRLEAS